MDSPLAPAKLKRTGIGKAVKWAFIGFNILMLLYLIVGFAGASEELAEAGTSQQEDELVLHTGVGLVAVFVLWLVGDSILGVLLYLTKPKQ